MKLQFLATLVFPALLTAEVIEADLLIVGGDESGCAAAVQAARLGVKRVVLINDIDWLGGQFCTQGIGPADEWTIVNDKRVEFPVSGLFAEILERMHAHNRRVYGLARPGNSWCGANTIEPRAAAQIFEEWLAPHAAQVRVFRGWEPVKVHVESGRVTGVDFINAQNATLTVKATLTADSSDWGDVIRLSGAAYMAGPDLKSRFGEPSAPERLDEGGEQEMNPISWCPLLRESEDDSVIPRPPRYDAAAFADWKKAPQWVDWDGSGGIYNTAGWCIYTHRRMVDRHHLKLAPGTEAVILNWPAHDYPLSTLPQHVVQALEENEVGSSRKNIIAMSPAQRRIVFADAKQRALEFVHWLQSTAPEGGDPSFRRMHLADDYGTADHLPPKPYIREGLRLEALSILREQDVRTEVMRPLWARVMVPDGVFGYQFNMDFHPTRRKFQNDDTSASWQPKFFGTRNWNAHTDRAMFPLRGLVPVKMDGLLGCSKNIGVTSMVQSSLRLHGQMMHVGTAVGTLAAQALRAGVQPREIAQSPAAVRGVQRVLVRTGVLIWPWHDVRQDEPHFEAANLLTLAGIWQADKDSVFFKADQPVHGAELDAALLRLCRVIGQKLPELPASPDKLTWEALNQALIARGLPGFTTLKHAKHKDHPLTRAECVDYLYRVLRLRGEQFADVAQWFQPL